MKKWERFEKLYADLYGCLKEVKKRYKKQYVSFTAIEGCRYKDVVNCNGKPFRFMLIGRAVNGWDEYIGRNAQSEREFVEASMINLRTEPNSMVLHGKDRFEYIDTSGAVAKNVPREGIDANPDEIKEKPYILNTKPFWYYLKEVWDGLYGQETKWSDRWFENIVWSNLYKIAPTSGNPNVREQKLQRKVCCSLLKEEIDIFDPTHIIFVTGEEWFRDFQHLFYNVKVIGRNISRNEKNDIYVETTAEYKVADGKICKVIVACRPEQRIKAEYVNDVIKHFSNN